MRSEARRLRHGRVEVERVKDAQFYATAAQVIPTLLIVMALELRRLPVEGQQRRALVILFLIGLVVTMLGEALALIGTRGNLGEPWLTVVYLAFAFQLSTVLLMAVVAVAEWSRGGSAARRMPGE
jgi:hypothetical protein